MSVASLAASLDLSGCELRGLTVPSYKIFLDRYSVKDKTRETLQEGDLVLAPSATHEGQREFARVAGLTRPEGMLADKASVHVRFFDGSELLGIRADHLDKPLELDPAQMWCRVADGVAQNRKEATDFAFILQDWTFVPAGRILAFAGTGQKLTGSNCFVLASPHDSRGGIWKTQAQMAEIFARGGGCGINISSLRPRYSYVKGVNGRSSGSVSWGALYSFVTGLIEQGGSRRGALMLILNVWHPDVLEFIDVKREEGVIANANLSVALSEEFMEAVRSDRDWQLEFPDTDHPEYDLHWNGDILAWKERGLPTIVHETVRAREVWDKICASAHACADPGIWFEGRANRLSNSAYFNRLICTNPCGEQSLPAWGVCNLGHLNLTRFLMSGRADFDYDRLTEVVRHAVRFLDNVIDGQEYYVPETGEQQKRERRIGLGTMGLGEALIRLGVRYGSEEALQLTRTLYRHIAVAAYRASADLAQERGAFPLCSSLILDRPFVQQVVEAAPELGEKIRSHGLRNVTLLTQAPTGTVGTMVGTTTGIEPYYAWETWRNSRVGIHMEVASVVADYRRVKGEDEPLPDWFVTALELTPEEHVRMQAAAQAWTDASISKTINCPADWTMEQVQKLYELMYDLGCKGGTVYRDKCKERQVLSLEQPDEPLGAVKVSAKQALAKKNGKHGPNGVAVSAPEVTVTKLSHGRAVRPLPKFRTGFTTTVDTPLGNAHITLNRDPDDDQPFEVFVDVGKGGSEVKAMAEALGRACSLLLRLDSNVSPDRRLQLLVEQFQGIGGPRPQGFGPNKVASLPDGVALALAQLGLGQELQESDAQPEPVTHPGDFCPSCHQPAVVRQDGCEKCMSPGCGWSAC